MTAAASDVDQLGIIVASELARHPVQIRACRMYRTRHIGLGLRPELARDDAFVGAGHLCPPRKGKSLRSSRSSTRDRALLAGRAVRLSVGEASLQHCPDKADHAAATLMTTMEP